MNLSRNDPMKCPTCPDTLLAATDREGVEIDLCPGCRGMWLDHGELDTLLAASPAPPPASGSGRFPRSQRNPAQHRKSRLREICD